MLLLGCRWLLAKIILRVIFTLTETSIKLIVVYSWTIHFDEYFSNVKNFFFYLTSDAIEIPWNSAFGFLENSFQHFTTLRSLYYSCGYTCPQPSLIFVHHKCFIVYFLIFRGFTVLMKNKKVEVYKYKNKTEIIYVKAFELRWKIEPQMYRSTYISAHAIH